MDRIRLTRMRATAAVVLRALTPCLVMLGLAACGDSGPSGPTAQASLVLRNDAGSPIQVVRFARCEDPDWGSNRLGAGETIAPGAVRTWSIAPGCWDLHAGTTTHSGYWYDGEVNAGGALQFALQPLHSQSNGMVPADVRPF
jgi:hypothetical protein